MLDVRLDASTLQSTGPFRVQFLAVRNSFQGSTTMKATIVTLVTAVVLAIQTSSAFGQGTLPTTLFGPPVTATTEITLSNLTTPAPTIPVDMDLALDHTQAAKFAWLEFIALVAPNKASPVRGEPGGPFSSVVGGAKST